MLAQQSASVIPCHRHRPKVASLQSHGVSSWQLQLPLWHTAQPRQCCAKLQQAQAVQRHAWRTFQVCCHASQQVTTTTTTASQPTVDLLSYRRDPSKAEACVQAIASAMVADPSTAYFCRDGKQFYVSILRLLLKLYPASPQLVIASDGQGVSAALCYAIPRMEPASWSALLSWDLLAAIAAVKPAVILDGLRGADFYESRRNAFIKEHGGCVLYLLAIGTDPDHQGRGLGSSVMAALTALADRQQIAMYLEATTTRSAALYARHGFTIMETRSSKPGAPSVTFMSRLPKPSHGRETSMAESSSSFSMDNSDASMSVAGREAGNRAVKGIIENGLGHGDGKQQGSAPSGLGQGQGIFSQYPLISRTRTRDLVHPDAEGNNDDTQ